MPSASRTPSVLTATAIITATETIRPASRTFRYVASSHRVRPVAFDRSVEERMNPLIDLGAWARDLALADPAHAHRLDQFVHRSGGNALHISFLDRCRQGFLRRASRLQK